MYVDKENKAANFNELIEKIKVKWSGWKSKLLSQAGRLQLIKSILSSVPLYRMGSFAFPKNKLSKLNTVVTNFFWGFKQDKPAMLLRKHFLFLPKHQGGLGIKSFSIMNQALLAKQFWCLSQNPSSLYSQWTLSKYFKGNIENHPSNTSQPSSVWRSLDNNSTLIKNHLGWQVGKGSNISLPSSFWWKPNTQTTSLNVSTLINHHSGTWNSSSINQYFNPSDQNEILQVPLPITDCNDRLCWSLSSDGHYQVSLGYQLLLNQ